MKPLVYIAGPYSHPDPVANTRRATEVGLELWECGTVVPMIPHLTLLAHAMFPHDVDYWYALDLDQLAHCDALLRLDGASTGADDEVKFALEHGIPVFYDIDDVVGWADTR